MRMDRRTFLAATGSSLLLPAAALASTSKLAFAGARFRYPTHNTQVFAARKDTASLCLVVGVTPNYVTRDHRFFMPGFWLLGAENEMTNSYRAAFSIDVGLTGNWLDGTLAGERVHEVTGIGRWTDRGLIDWNVPPRTPYAMLWLTGVDDGGWKMGSVNPDFGPLGHPEAIQVSSDFSSLLANLDAHAIQGNVTNPFGTNSAMLVPSHAVALAPLSARSILAVGDSVEYGWRATAYDARNDLGMIARGIDCWGVGVNDAAYPGAKTAGSFAKRAQVLNLLGQLPFDAVLTNAGTNDLMAAPDLATLTNLKLAEVANLRSVFPGASVFAQTLTPRSTGDFTTVAGQTPQPKCAAGGLMFQFNDFLRTAADGCLDLNPTLAAGDVWRADGGAFTTDGVHLTDHGSDVGTSIITTLAQGGALG